MKPVVKKKRWKAITIRVLLVIATLAVAAVVFYEVRIAHLNRQAMIQGDAVHGAYALAAVFEQESLSGRTDWNVPFGELIERHPSIAEQWGPLKYYEWRDFSAVKPLFASDGTFTGEVRVSHSSEGGDTLPSWSIDFSNDRQPSINSDVRRID